MRVSTNHENQADKSYRFIDENSAEGKKIENIIYKYQQYKKLTQKEVIEIIRNRGHKNFSRTIHKNLWRGLWKNAKNRNDNAKKYGELVVNNQWLWYEETWIPKVLELISQNI
ncbi:hypothetical protein [Legionella maceachernii]|uniref:Uncharacterized protein n=1 Tax=Legionella maceachernii TaxID=466 RepID=A0A0W0VYM9_9GAMM|nr:hypothetical protein [Legionella maceachernii]KTD25123.1 hypothetical protein Lmac_2101 [Legionella maceachernii]SKA27538.1 hypothetical protein SAMN02745128_02987 [Legionella maceachernii]SUP04672.1 Uncharacterised protein [Legionella maceachernii]